MADRRVAGLQKHPVGALPRIFVAVSPILATIGLLAMMLDTAAAPATRAHIALSAIVSGVWAVFGVAFVSRVWLAPRMPAAAPLHPRRSYLLSPNGAIDLLAVVALPLGWLLADEPRDAQLFALVWVAKYFRHSAGFALLLRVLERALPALISVVTVFFVVFLLAATLSYLLERGVQPNTFDSIPHAMWWAIVTLTTTGYGDVVPTTIAGRMLAGWVMVGGLVIFALWAGIIANAFAEELRRRHFLRTWDLVVEVPFFQNLGAAAIADIVRLLRARDVAAGTVLIREGESGDAMYFIVSGEATVRLRPHDVVLGPGSFFGEMALLFRAPRAATVAITRPSVLLVLDIADFRELAGRRPELMNAIEVEAKRRQAANAAMRHATLRA